ncbi:MAG: oxygen-independent coproporphyrinogen III oxidase [Deltaproteobacteria bacterium]|nr:MAG: oxygen-independent coproporphyrinogen III oxidase [Deltaproteobacteria bacterium]
MVVRKHVDRVAAPYVDRVLAEAHAVARYLGHRPVARLHLGGGTPNYLGVPALRRLLEGLSERFAPTEDAEWAIECDPRQATPEETEAIFSLGFNRLSVGVQDFDPAVQAAIGRRQSFEETRRVVEAARAAGARSVNVDLVYGLPAQSEARLARTLERVLALSPDRLAVFSFAYVPQIRPHQKKIDPARLPPPEAKARMLVRVIETLTGAGYVQVGMDHFARQSDPLARSLRAGTLFRSFQGYEPGPELELVGLGATAIGDIGGAYVQNHHRLGAYEAAVDAGRLPVERGLARSPDDQIRREVIASILCRFELSFDALAARHGIDHDRYFRDALPELERLEAEGLLHRHPRGLTLTPLGRLFVRNVAMAYDAYRGRLGARFSRTV